MTYPMRLLPHCLNFLSLCHDLKVCPTLSYECRGLGPRAGIRPKSPCKWRATIVDGNQSPPRIQILKKPNITYQLDNSVMNPNDKTQKATQTESKRVNKTDHNAATTWAKHFNCTVNTNALLRADIGLTIRISVN